MQLWALLIDIEGFSSTYDSDMQALVSLGAMLESVIKIGSLAYPETPSRLFAHHVGDSVVVVGEFGAEVLAQPVAIGIAVLQSVLRARGMAKAVLAEGEFAGINGCFPPSVREALQKAEDGRIRLGHGVMTLLPVMGSAWINAYRLQGDKRCPHGALFVAPASIAPRLPAGTKFSVEGEFTCIDWLHSDTAELTQLLDRTRLFQREPGIEERAVKEYIAKRSPPANWADGTLRYLGLKGDI